MDLNTKISFKDIDFKKIKAFLKRKETIIAICVLIFVGVIIFVGNLLIDDYLEAVNKKELAQNSYERITRSDTNVESLKSKIETAKASNEELLVKLTEIDREYVSNLLLDIQEETGLSWEDRTLTIRSNIKDAPDLKAVAVNISKFYGSYEDIKNFLAYMKDYDREVSIDSFSFGTEKQTGRISGSMTLMFYMKNNEATQEDD